MIDYASWQAPKAESSKTEPSVLSPAQRQVFWMIVSGRSLVSIAEEIGRSHRTVEAHKYEIERRIPGLLGLACYGMLAMEILKYRSLDGDVFGKARQWESLTQAQPAESGPGTPTP